MFPPSFLKTQKLSNFPIAGIFTPIYKKILRIAPTMYICLESSKLKLSHDIKIMIVAFQNKKLVFFILFFFMLIRFFSLYFFRKIMCSLMPFQRYQICPNRQSNIDMVNKNKKCDTEFWSDFKTS